MKVKKAHRNYNYPRFHEVYINARSIQMISGPSSCNASALTTRLQLSLLQITKISLTVPRKDYISNICMSFQKHVCTNNVSAHQIRLRLLGIN